MHDLGYRDEYNYMGSIQAAFSVPNIMSGALSTEYVSQVQGHDASVVFTKPHAGYEMILGTGSFEADEVALLSKAGDTFFRLSGLKPTELIDTEVQKVLQKYDKVWLSLSAKDIESSFSGASQNDLMSYQISRAISTMTLADLESYMTQYPIWKNTKDLGVSGDIHSYAVEVNQENILAMTDAFVKKATGKPLDESTRKDITNSLTQIHVDGTMSFDVAHKDVATFSGTITASGSTGTLATFLIKETKDALSFSSDAGGKTVVLDLAKSPEKNTISFIAKENNAELLNLSGSITKDGSKVDSINMTLSAQWMTAELIHKNNKDGSFVGKLNFGIGNISWKGAFDHDALTALSVVGAVIGKSLSLDLTKSSDDIIRGPLVVKSWSDEISHASIGLRLIPERFLLTVDMPMPGATDPSSGQSHAEIDITAKNVKTPVTIATPSPVQSFKTLSDELSAIVWTETGWFVEGENIQTQTWSNGSNFTNEDRANWNVSSDALPITNN